MFRSTGLCKRRALAFAVTFAVMAPFASARAYTETVLYRFNGGADGNDPVAGVILDQSGNLAGTTQFGGGLCGKSKGCGTVFKLAPDGTETVLHAFDGFHGKWPRAGLVADQAGNLYGTTSSSDHADGTVFELTPDGVFTTLHAFTGGSDGATPDAQLIMDQAGNLYGTASSGGPYACGTVFEITPAGDFSVLYTFQGGTDGCSPGGPLLADSAGNFYGTTILGGAKRCSGSLGSCGTVFKLAPDGVETVLYAFRGGRNGSSPQGGLIWDSAGNLYGTTEVGGGMGCDGGVGCGTVFDVAPDGTETVVSRFNRAGGPTDPVGGVVMDLNGNLVGASSSGGSAGCGTVFRVAPGHQARAVYSFTCGRDGRNPRAGLVQIGQGEFYGTTEGGGNGYGTVFAVQP